MISQDAGGHRPSPAGSDGAQNGLLRLGHPLPVSHAVNPGRGFVRGDSRGGQELGLDSGAGGVERRAHAEGIGDGAFGDGQSEHLPQHLREPLEADMMAVTQLGQQRAAPWAKGRSQRHGGGRLGPVAPPARSAAAAKHLDPRHHWTDLRQINLIVAVPTALCRRRRPARVGGGSSPKSSSTCWPRPPVRLPAPPSVRSAQAVRAAGHRSRPHSGDSAEEPSSPL